MIDLNGTKEVSIIMVLDVRAHNLTIWLAQSGRNRLAIWMLFNRRFGSIANSHNSSTTIQIHCLNYMVSLSIKTLNFQVTLNPVYSILVIPMPLCPRSLLQDPSSHHHLPRCLQASNRRSYKVTFVSELLHFYPLIVKSIHGTLLSHVATL